MHLLYIFFKLLMNGYSPFNGIDSKLTVSQASPGLGDVAVERDNYCFKAGFKPQSVATPPLESLRNIYRICSIRRLFKDAATQENGHLLMSGIVL